MSAAISSGIGMNPVADIDRTAAGTRLTNSKAVFTLSYMYGVHV